MILAASHRQPLNGNKRLLIFFLFFSLLFFSQCATRKSIPVNTQKNPPAKPTSEKPVKIDTVVWKNEPAKKAETPVVTPSTNKSDEVVYKPTGKYKKEIDQLRIVALVPFKTSGNDTSTSRINSASTRYVHFYAGMNMAIDELSREAGKKVVIDVYDCESVEEAAVSLANYSNMAPHIIIGPQKVEALKYVATWSKDHETTLISPWVSSPSITEENPYYIQTKAGLSAHYQNINEHARAKYPTENIILISKSIDESKLKNFNDSNKYKDIVEKIIKENDLATGVDPIITPMLKETGPTVFILPMASSKDENYIYHFLRRVVSEKTNKEIIVYGMYKWLEMKADIIDYMNVYKIRLSISNYFDQDNQNIKSFKKRYFDKYREFPSQDALEGYDVMKYSIRNLRAHGSDFQFKNLPPHISYLETMFDIKPIHKLITPGGAPVLQYYENAYVKIVELRNNRYRIVE
ncbi:MAG: amino acid ABC transporter substrate-binding protein [Saprospiraceae bacterium]|nr:amino acid ABC transporter substrate-binding protein [Saprospiraceae bacterium]